MVSILAAGDPSQLWRFRPHPEVWLLVVGLAFLWWYAVRRIGPKATLPGETVMTRSQLAWGGAALLTLWAASDWPIHDIGEQYLYSVHMFQHILFQFAVAPMILLATPTWLARILIGSGRGYRVLKRMTRIVPATLLFNVVVVGSHIPWIVNHAVVNAPLHYGVHILVLGSALIMWMPVCGPLPELRFPLPVQAGHLLLQTIVPTVPAGWLTMADGVVYKTYARTGHIWGMTTVEDQQVAGALMKLGEAAVLWVLIGILFMRWATQETKNDRDRGMELDRRAPEADRLTWEQVQRELATAPPAPVEPPAG
jgi:putative membrane protein